MILLEMIDGFEVTPEALSIHGHDEGRYASERMQM